MQIFLYNHLDNGIMMMSETSVFIVNFRLPMYGEIITDKNGGYC